MKELLLNKGGKVDGVRLILAPSKASKKATAAEKGEAGQNGLAVVEPPKIYHLAEAEDLMFTMFEEPEYTTGEIKTKNVESDELSSEEEEEELNSEKDEGEDLVDYFYDQPSSSHPKETSSKAKEVEETKEEPIKPKSEEKPVEVKETPKQ